MNEAVFGPYATSRQNGTMIADGAAMLQRTRELEQRGWGMPTLATHTTHFGPLAQPGAHALSISANADGTMNEWNNWGGMGTNENRPPNFIFGHTTWPTPAPAARAPRR
jgi:hypothetical protein